MVPRKPGRTMADLLTSWRHLFAAVLVLGSEAGGIAERLQRAYSVGLSKLSPRQALSNGFGGELESLMRGITELYGTGRPVDEQQASALAKRVVALYDRVTRELQ